MNLPFMNRPDFVKLDKADPDALLQAVAVVNANYDRNGKKPGAEHWQNDTRRYRHEMIGDVFLEWSRIAGTDVVFPWHDDYVAEVWVSFRKMALPQRILMWEFFGIEVPQRLLKQEAY
jgi:hypothetical protein